MKSRGASSQIHSRRYTRMKGVLTTKVSYRALCFLLTKAQQAKLEALYRTVLWAITGLPRHTRVEEL